MIQILKHLETITQYRDRTLLELGVVSALFELLHAHEINLYKVVEFEESGYWYEDAVHVMHGNVRFHDPDLADESQLRSMSERPDMLAAIEQVTWVCMEIDGLKRHCAPVIHDSHTLAIVEIFSKEALDTAGMEMAESFLRLYDNFTSLLDYSERDTLTGLLNRKTLDERLHKILVSLTTAHSLNDQPTEAERLLYPMERRQPLAEGHSHWLAVLDIDHFKQINDHFGHLYGDEVLILLSNLMRKGFRRNDQLFRFGGEEFVIVLRPCTIEGALTALERLRQTVESHPFPQVGRVTISIGFAPLTMALSPTETLGHADEALYHAKRHGRNQVCSFNQLVADGELAQTPAAMHTDLELF